MSDREYKCDGAPLCVECTPSGDLCYPGGGLMSAADEARDRGMEHEDIVAARRWKGGGALRVALSAVKVKR